MLCFLNIEKKNRFFTLFILQMTQFNSKYSHLGNYFHKQKKKNLQLNGLLVENQKFR